MTFSGWVDFGTIEEISD